MGRTIPRKQIQAFENRIYNQLNQIVKQKIKKWSVSVSTQLGNPGEVRQAAGWGAIWPDATNAIAHGLQGTLPPLTSQGLLQVPGVIGTFYVIPQ